MPCNAVDARSLILGWLAVPRPPARAGWSTSLTPHACPREETESWLPASVRVIRYT
jgi:hypothetical protein